MKTTRRGFLISASGLVLTAGLPSLPRAAGYTTEAVQDVVDGDGVLALFSVIRDRTEHCVWLYGEVMALQPFERSWTLASYLTEERWIGAESFWLEGFESNFIRTLREQGIRDVRPVEYPSDASRFERVYWKRIRG